MRFQLLTMAFVAANAIAQDATTTLDQFVNLLEFVP
jgi:hypothetical protein